MLFDGNWGLAGGEAGDLILIGIFFLKRSRNEEQINSNILSDNPNRHFFFHSVINIKENKLK